MVAIRAKRLVTLLVAAASTFLLSCNGNVVFSEYKKLPEEGWRIANTLSYDVTIDDNSKYHNVYLTVRHADAYPYSNLYLFLKTTYPDGKVSSDTLECILANKKGEWQGDGAGDLWDNKILLKKNLHFPQTGKYTFTFEQGMRSDPLPMILDFGMVIEKAN